MPLSSVNYFFRSATIRIPYPSGSLSFAEHASYETEEQAVGYTVLVAADGVEGVSVFKQYQPNIALLLTDVMMPNMNGFDLADCVLELDSQLPVLFISGNAQQADRGWGCVAKPFTSAALVSRVWQALNTPSHQLQSRAGQPTAVDFRCGKTFTANSEGRQILASQWSVVLVKVDDLNLVRAGGVYHRPFSLPWDSKTACRPSPDLETTTVSK